IALVGHVAREGARLSRIEGLRGGLVHAEGQVVVVVDVGRSRPFPQPVVGAVGLPSRKVPDRVRLGLEDQHRRTVRSNERGTGHCSSSDQLAGPSARAGTATGTLTAGARTDPPIVRATGTEAGT